MAKKDNTPGKTVIAQNRKARYEYTIEEIYETGIVLVGSEVKSLRQGKANISEAYAHIEGAEIFLLGAHISEYTGANRFNHHPTRPRKLLLNRSEIRKLIGKVQMKGYTLVPLSFYFNEKNMIKVELGLAKGKKLHDKRATEKERDWQRNKERLLKE